MNDIIKMQKSLADIAELADEVENFLFLPKRFRHMNHLEWQKAQPRYLAYLRNEEKIVTEKIKRLTDGTR